MYDLICNKCEELINQEEIYNSDNNLDQNKISIQDNEKENKEKN